MMNEINDNQKIETSYGRILHYLVTAGFIFLFVSFLMYAFGVLPSFMEAHRVPEIWAMPADEAQERIARPSFWAWVVNLHRADLLSLGSLAVLTATTPVAFLFLLAKYLKRKDFPYAAMVFAEVLVLLFAASGVIGGH